MGIGIIKNLLCLVALRKESVDRNPHRAGPSARRWVALRKESVDRNILPVVIFRILRVALRKESVDRNIRQMPLTRFFPGSLSARRAWIEIT